MPSERVPRRVRRGDRVVEIGRVVKNVSEDWITIGWVGMSVPRQHVTRTDFNRGWRVLPKRKR